jgi:DNA-binding response OmpR family regulator
MAMSTFKSTTSSASDRTHLVMTMDASPRHLNNRKAIHAAGVLIIQPDAGLATEWRDALVDFGMNGARTVATIDDALASIGEGMPSDIVVAFPALDEAHRFIDRIADGEAGDLDAVPIVLVMGSPTRAAVLAAVDAGFDAVLPFPLPPRLIYRRMGSLMQRARRAMRQLAIAVPEETAGPGAVAHDIAAE